MNKNPISNSMPDLGRRLFLKRVALTVATLPLFRVSPLHADEPPQLSPNDPAAKTIGYTEDASRIDPKNEPLFKPNSRCVNCTFFQTAQAKGENAPCTVFANQRVVSKGWCRAWSARP